MACCQILLIYLNDASTTRMDLSFAISSLACVMGSFFHTITEENKLTLNKPTDSDLVYYSELNNWYTENSFRSFCLKYVVDRSIYFKVGKKEHTVNAGSFLLGCKQPYVNAYFESKQVVKSICIDICPVTVAEAFTVLTAQDNHNFDNYLAPVLDRKSVV